MTLGSFLKIRGFSREFRNVARVAVASVAILSVPVNAQEANRLPTSQSETLNLAEAYKKIVSETRGQITLREIQEEYSNYPIFKKICESKTILDNFVAGVNLGISPAKMLVSPKGDPETRLVISVLENFKLVELFAKFRKEKMFGMHFSDMAYLLSSPDFFEDPKAFENLKSLSGVGVNYSKLFNKYLQTLVSPHFNILHTQTENRTAFQHFAFEKLKNLEESDKYWDIFRRLQASSTDKSGGLAIFLIAADKNLLYDQKYADFLGSEVANLFQDVTHEAVTRLVGNINAAYVNFELVEKMGVHVNMLDINNYLELMKKLEVGSALEIILSESRAEIFTQPILDINLLHNESDQKRLAVLKPYSARAILEILTTAGPDAYLSSFKLAYNNDNKSKTREELAMDFVGKVKAECETIYKGMLEKAKAECGTLHAYFLKIKDGEYRLSSAEFVLLIKSLSLHNYLQFFLNDLGSFENQKEILNLYFYSQYEKISISDLNSIYDLLDTKSKKVNDMTYHFLLKKLESTDMETRNTATTLLLKYFHKNRGIVVVPDSFTATFEKYQTHMESKNTSLKFQDLWRKEIVEGKETFISTQVSLSYDDTKDSKNHAQWDGHQSVDNLLKVNGGGLKFDKVTGEILSATVGKDWKIKNETTFKKNGYLVLEKRVKLGIMRHIITLPKEPVEVTSDFSSADVVLGIFKPQIINHIGHSYHARSKSLDLINSYISSGGNVVFTNLRSCGGEREFSKLYDMGVFKMFGTRGVGTMRVNDPFSLELNKRIEAGQVDFEKFKAQFKNNDPRYQFYIWPQDNVTVQLRSLYDQVEKDGTKK